MPNPPQSSTPLRKITPLDPDTPNGRAATDAINNTLARIQLRIWQREAATDRQAA